MKMKHPLSVLTLTLTPFFMATGCSSHGVQTATAPTPVAASQPAASSWQQSDTTHATIEHAMIEPEAPISEHEPTTIDSDLVASTNDTAANDGTSPSVAEEIGLMEEALMAVNNTLTTETPVTNARPAKLTFRFGFDKSTLSAEEKAIITGHGEYLANHPLQGIVIHGHADAQGDPTYNALLADKRAQHVASLLKAAGAQDAQIEIFSWSSDAPAEVATNYKANRRVELSYGDDFYAQKSE